ncbi:MAG: UvrD-helicase domain-containing protein [Clostridia bacterium]|nr:UvrD-helicase domain-containing protein [Clostridia bacterium]
MTNWTQDQKQAIDLRNTNLLVSAAAGSGKTSVLIERIYSLIASGETSVDRLLVATFTNAAAASMREKLVVKLDEAIAENDGNERLLEQKSLLERADISTVHAFCIKTLRRYYFNTPLPPDFRIIDSTQFSLLSSLALSETLEACAKRCEDGLFPEYAYALNQLFVTTAKNDSVLENAVLSLNAFVQSLPDVEAFRKAAIDFYENPSSSFWQDEILSYCKNLLTLGIEYAQAIRNKYQFTPIGAATDAYADKFISALEAARAANSALEMAVALSAMPRDGSKKSPLKEERDRSFALIKGQVVDKVRSTLSALNCENVAACRDTVKALFEMEREYADRLEELMLEQGGTTFAGVLRYMCRLLDENPLILEDIRNGFDFVFVDEYQDVNALQNYILEKVSTKNNMFFVGDIKQSIYGFQLARPQLFLEKMRTYSQGVLGTRINLKNNFRSYAPILEGVNFIFENVMSADVAEIDYDLDARLNPSDDKSSPQFSDSLFLNGSLEPANEFLFCESDKWNNSPAYEGEAIALRIKELMNCTVFDKKRGAMRPVRYGDIVILGRTNAASKRFEAPFRKHGIPFNSTASDSVSADCVAHIVSVLRLLVLRRDDVNLICAMLSCIGGFTPDELALIRSEQRRGSFFDALAAYNKNEKLKGKIDGFFALLDKLELIQHTMSLADFIEYICAETGYIYYVSSLPQSSNGMSELRNFISLARKYRSFSDGGLRGFLEYYDSMESFEKEAESFDENDNSVHYMTIHKSKGLEFPIVILSGTADISRNNKKHLLSFNEDLGVGFNPFIVDENGVRAQSVSPVVQALNFKEDLFAHAESMRVLYVALTRPKNKLIVSVCATRKKISELCVIPGKLLCSTFANYAELMVPLIFSHRDGQPLREFIEAENPFDFIYSDSSWQVNVVPLSRGILQADSFSEDTAEQDDSLVKNNFDEQAFLKKVDAALKWEYAFKSAVTQRSKHSPSKNSVVRTPIPLRRPKFEDKEYLGAQKGTVVHYFMEHISFSSGENALTQAKNLLSSGILTQREFDAIPFESIDAFLFSPFADRMRASEMICRERSFCMILPFGDGGDKTLVQGIIDCYFFEGDNIILLDYKTDVIRDNLNERILHHTPQLKMYKDALEKLYPGKSVTPFVHFFSVNETVEIK